MATINIHHQMALLKHWLSSYLKYYCSEQLLHSQLQDTNKPQSPQSSPSDTHILMAKPSLGLGISNKPSLCLLNFTDPLMSPTAFYVSLFSALL